MLLAAGVYANHHQYAQPFARAPEDGLVVYGFGERKTPEAFRNACNRFIYVENLIGDGSEKGAAAATREKKDSPRIRLADVSRWSLQCAGRSPPGDVRSHGLR